MSMDNDTTRDRVRSAALIGVKQPEAQPDRQALQATGAHPAPCARHCEAQAFRIELCWLYSENETLRTGYSAARLEIESLKERVQQLGQLARDVNSRRVTELEEQLAAVGAGGVEPLRKRECLHQISEPAQAMLAHFLEKEAPRIDAAGLDAERHCCEHTLYLERERLHAAIAAQKENHD